MSYPRFLRRNPNPVLVLTLVTALILGLAACGRTGNAPSAGAPQGPATAKEITVAISLDEGTLSPFTQETGYPGTNLSLLVYDTLLRLDADNQVRPRLGAGAEPSQESKVFTVPLRSGVTWHDGRPFSGADVKFSVDYYTKNNISDSAPDVSNIASVGVEPDKVVFTLKSPDPEFPLRVLTDMRILPQHVWQSITDPKTATVAQAVGTGPYKLVAHEKDRSYTLETNNSYALGKAKIDRIRISVIPEQQTYVAALRTGEVHMVTRLLPTQVAREVANQPGVTVARGSDFASTLMVFNASRPPFDRAEVRTALAMAIDRDELVRTVLLGDGAVGAPGFVHPDAPNADASLKARFDQAEAARMLDGLGARPGPDGVRVLDGKPMSYELITPSNNPVRLRSAELIAEMLKKVGVAVKVTSLDFKTVQQKAWPDFDASKARDYELAMWGWSPPTQLDTTDVAATVFSDTGLGRLNISATKEADIDEASRAVFAATTLEQRAEASKRLQRLIAERQPYVTLFYQMGAYGYRSETYGGWVYQKGAGILNTMSFVDLPN